MLFWIEALVACLLFTIPVAISVYQDPMNWISDYPPAIQQRARELGLVPKEQKSMPAAAIVRKTVGSLIICIALAAVLVWVNDAQTFWQGFCLGYGLWLVVDWYDAFVIDCLWFCHSKKIILPGTEDMISEYHNYGFHMKMSAIGMLLGLPVCLLAAIFVVLLQML